MDEKTKQRWLSAEPIDSKTYTRPSVKMADKVDYLKQRGYVPVDDTELTDEGKVVTPDRVIAKGGNQRKL